LFQLRRRDLDELARLRVELAELLVAEIAVPDIASRIDDYVVRLDRRAREIPLGDDDARALALRPQVALELVGPAVAGLGVLVDRREIFGLRALELHAVLAHDVGVAA